MGVDFYTCKKCTEIFHCDYIRCPEKCHNCWNGIMYCYNCLPYDENEEYKENEDIDENNKWICDICIENHSQLDKYSGLEKDLLLAIKKNKLSERKVKLVQKYLDELINAMVEISDPSN